MQHAVGSPLPPPPQPGHGPAVGWSRPHTTRARTRAPPRYRRDRRPDTPRRRRTRRHPRRRRPRAPSGRPRHPRRAPDTPGRPLPYRPRRTPPAMWRCRPGRPWRCPACPPPRPPRPTRHDHPRGAAHRTGGAGKTSVAKYWADHRRVPTAHISLDDVREWVRSGFADPQTGWNENSEAQYRLARRTCGFSARNFLANGISCILDDAVFPDRPVVGLGGWKRHVGPACSRSSSCPAWTSSWSATRNGRATAA